MKAEEIHEMSDADLRRTLEENRQELFNLRFQIATRKTKNHQRLPAVKKDIARILTALRERELIDLYGGPDMQREDQLAAPAPVSEAAPRRSMFRRSR